jgi:hypothetical protein
LCWMQLSSCSCLTGCGTPPKWTVPGHPRGSDHRSQTWLAIPVVRLGALTNGRSR